MQALKSAIEEAKERREGGDWGGARRIVAGAVEELLGLAAAEGRKEFTDLLLEAGRVAYQGGDLQVAHDAFEQVVTLRSRTLPDDHRDLQAARHRLAWTKYELGHLRDALVLQEKVLEVRSRTLPDDHPDLQAARGNFAAMRRALGDPRGALVLQEKVLEVFSRTLRDDEPDLQIARHDLALTKYALGDLPGALALQEEVVEVLSRTVPDEDRKLLKARGNLALTRSALGDLRGALALEEKNLEVCSRTLPDHHPDLQKARRNLALTKRALGDLPGALALQEKVVEVLSRTRPNQDRELLKARGELAVTVRALGDLRGALALQEQILEVLSRTLPEGDPDLQRARGELAATKDAVGDFRGALALGQQVLEVLSRTRRDEDPDLQAARGNLAATKYALGDLPGARVLQEKVLEVRSRTLPDDHPDLQAARSNLAATKAELGDLQGALAIQEKVLEILSRTLLEDHPDLQAARGNLALTEFLLGDPGAARSHVRGAWEAAEKRLGFLSSALSLRAQEEAQQGLHTLLSHYLSFRDPSSPERVAAWEELEAVVRHRDLLDRQARLRAFLFQAASADQDIARLIVELEAARTRYFRAYRTTDETRRQELPALRAAVEQAEEKLAREAKKLPGAREILAPSSLSELVAKLSTGATAVVTVEDSRTFAVEAPTADQSGQDVPTRAKALQLPAVTAFVLAAGGRVERVELGARVPLEELARAWRAALAAQIRLPRGGVGRRVEAKRDAQEVGGKLRALLEPLLETLPEDAKVLFVIPDGVLATLPWEALRLDDGVLLGERYRVTYGTNLSVLSCKPAPAVKPSLLALGGADYGGEPEEVPGTGGPASAAVELASLRSGTGSWAPLPGSAEEAEAVMRLFEEHHPGAGPVFLLQDRRASREAFLGLASRCRYLHLATHTFVASEELWTTREQVLERGFEHGKAEGSTSPKTSVYFSTYPDEL